MGAVYATRSVTCVCPTQCENLTTLSDSHVSGGRPVSDQRWMEVDGTVYARGARRSVSRPSDHSIGFVKGGLGAASATCITGYKMSAMRGARRVHKTGIRNLRSPNEVI